METKYVLIIMALIGATFLSYPSTFALFANDHAYYNGSAQCTKCHGDIQLQLGAAGRVTELHMNLDADYGCRACHANANNTRGRNITQDYHAAYSPECIECHDNVSSIYGTQEAHTLIVTGAATSTLTAGISEACMMCHTTMYGSVTVRNRQVFAFEADSITANGSPVYDGSYETVFLSQPTDGGHNFVSDVLCVVCHMPVYERLNQSGHPNDEHRRVGCIGCHRGSRGSGDIENSQLDINPVTYHAAKTKYCSDCHGEVAYPRDCNQCHNSHGGFKPGVN